MSNFRRRFSTLKGRLSFTDQDDSPPAQIKKRLQMRRNTSTNSTNTSSDSNVEPENLTRAALKGKGKQQSTMSIATPNPMTQKDTTGMIDFSAMPGTEEINRLFDQVLAEMAIPAQNQDKLRQQDDKKKWALIQAHMKYNPSKKGSSTSKNKQSPDYWVDVISQRDAAGKPPFSANDAMELQAVFRTSHREFLLDFLQLDGVPALNRLVDYYTNLDQRTKPETEILSHLVESYRLLMNNEVGMEGVLLVPGSMVSIAMAMDFQLHGNDTLTEKVVLLLSVACWWSEKGRKKVMEAIKQIKVRKRELSKFQTLVFLFEFTQNPSFKASIATFITTVCNTPPTIEERVKIRNELLALNIIRIFDQVMAKAKLQSENNVEAEAWEAVETQYEVFVTMMRQDQKEIVHKLVRAAETDESYFDLSNLAESWKLLQRNANRADCQDQLLNVVQALFMVPTENTIAVPIFDSIVKYIFEATSFEKIGQDGKKLTEPPDLTFDTLGKLFKTKMEYDAKVNTFYEKQLLVRRQQRIIKILQQRLVDVTSGKVPLTEGMNLKNLIASDPELMKMGFGKGVSGGAGGGSGGAGKGGATRNVRGGKGGGSGGIGATSVNNGVPNGNGGSSAIDITLLTGLGLTETANEIEIMKEREAKLKKEIETLEKEVAALKLGGAVAGTGAGTGATAAGGNDLIKNYKGKLDSTGLVPAGIAPGKTKKDPPPVPAPGMPGSLENAPIKFDKAALAKPGGATDAASGGTLPGKGGLEALFAAKAATMKPKADPKKKHREALEKLGLPDKKPIIPNGKMTHVYWNVVNPENLEGTIWPELSDQNVKFNPTELEELFGKKPQAEVMKKTLKNDEAAKSDLIKLIDSQRRQNVAIALKRLKLSNKEIRAALLSVDESILNLQTVQVFLDTAPTPDEMTLLEKYVKDGSDPKMLEEEERYLFTVAEIPDLQDRLQCVKTKHTFKTDRSRVLTLIQCVKAAVVEIKGSSQLKVILEIVLAIGNYLNGGTTRGAAWGYKIDILPQLITIKDAVNNGTLMHYLYVLFERNYPDLIEFSLPACGKAIDISLKDISVEMNNIAKSVQLLKTVLKSKNSVKGDNFSKVMSPFEVKASKEVQTMQEELEKVRTDFQNLAMKFAETGNTVEPKTFFPKFVEFEHGLKRAKLQIEDMRVNQEKKKAADAQKLERQTLMKLKKLVEATRGDDGQVNLGLIEAFKRSQNGRATEVVDRFLERYKQEQSRQRRSVRQPKGQRFLDE